MSTNENFLMYLHEVKRKLNQVESVIQTYENLIKNEIANAPKTEGRELDDMDSIDW